MSKIVERTLDLVELFAEEKRPLTLSDIARLLKIPISSCHDVLQAMQGRGYLYEIAPRAGYYPTLRLQMLGKLIGDHDPVVARADLLLRSLRDTLDETVLLAKVNGLVATYLLAFEATHPLRFMVRVGENVRSLHGTSAGKALLGSMDDRDLTSFLKSAKLPALTARTLTNPTDLRADLELSRQRGWYLNDGQSLEGVTTLSACFRWNSAVYIVTVAGPASRMEGRLEQASGLVTNVCKLLEMRQDTVAGAEQRPAIPVRQS
jgi:DNA-binding IclR family transcriptional regulator